MTTEAYGPREVGVRESTLPPWYVRHAEYDGYGIVLSDSKHPSARDHYDAARYWVAWAKLPYYPCRCGAAHCVDAITYHGDSLEDAEAAFFALEQQLLAGTLG